VRIDVLTLFPQMFNGPLNESIIKRAREKGILQVNLINIRDFSQDKHRTVDDYPYGGGPGMILKPEPVFWAVEFLLQEVTDKRPSIILLSPQGEVFNQDMAIELARENWLILICGHYEGVDERIRTHLATREISIGDYILTGGELPAMVLIDAITRLLPGAVGAEEGPWEDSFTWGLLEYPQYTRPRSFRGLEVPEVLLSGDHEKIRIWRRKKALERTLQRRPDLLNKINLTEEDRRLLAEIVRGKKDMI